MTIAALYTLGGAAILAGLAGAGFMYWLMDRVTR